MRNWYDIIPPHEDIREGRFDQAVFAADLGDVVSGTARPDYQDPYLFLRKTYFTQGLKALLARVHQKLTAGHGPAIMEVQTPFGGGKTHAILALYHYLRSGQELRELLHGVPDPVPAKLCAVDGYHWNPLDGRETDGVRRYTFWGELAFQLGGREGYERFREDDERRIAPGKDKLRDFLALHQPFVLLFDEILEYVNKALDVRDHLDVSLGTQTYSFFQELTGAVSALPHGIMVVTLPSSHLEDFGERSEEALARLNRIFDRVESIETPVEGEEIYEIIRHRLFEPERLRTGEMREVVHQYVQLYQQHKDEVPARARDADFRRKMERAYPFHPDVIDLLYERWSTYSTFQRTRGALRLLANIVGDLYQREAPIDLILPGDVNLAHSPVRMEFLGHIGQVYEGVIGSDIAGQNAKAQSLDAENRGWQHLGERVATAIFVSSFSADSSGHGINLPNTKLAVIRPDSIPSLVTEILQRLSANLWYLNTGGDAYYFSRIPNLNRMILDKKELFNESYRPRMEQIIRAQMGNEFSPCLWPADGEAIPDGRPLKLVVLKPEDDGAGIAEWIERKGTSFREFKNTVVFALADTAAAALLREDVKTLLALDEIEDEVRDETSPLPIDKLPEVHRRQREIERDLSWKVRRAYHTLRVGGRTIELGQPVAGNETLGHWYWRELTSGDRGLIVTQLHYRYLVNRFMAQTEQIPSALIRDQFYKNPELPMPSEQGVVARAIQLGVQDGALGLADLRDGEVARDSLRFNRGIPLGDVTFDEGEVLLSRALCEALLERWRENAGETPPPTPEPGAGDGGPRPPEGGGVGCPTPPPGPPVAVERYHRVRLVIKGIAASKIADVNRGILIPLSSVVDGGLTITLELDVTSAEGIAKAILENTIKETIRQIGAQVTEEVKE